MSKENTGWGYIIMDCCGRKSVRSEKDKKTLINRLKRIEGQIRGIEEMIKNDVYCSDILQQSSAAHSALGSFNLELLNLHMHTCVVRDIKDGKEETVDELSDTIKRMFR